MLRSTFYANIYINITEHILLLKSVGLFNCYYFEVRLMTLCVEENIVANDDFSAESRANFKLFHNPVRELICPTLRENG